MHKGIILRLYTEFIVGFRVLLIKMNHAQSYKIVLCFKAPGPSMTNEGKFPSLKIQVNNNISSKIND